MGEVHVTIAATLAGEAERKVQKIILDLDERLRDMDVCVDGVNIDTRRWANMAVEIAVAPATKR